jgi:hypothetical protein
MSGDPIERIRLTGTELVDKADELEDLGRGIPEASRKLRAYGELLIYVAGECDRLESHGIKLSRDVFPDPSEVQQTLSWQVPTQTQVRGTIVGASGYSTSITQPLLSYAYETPNLNILGNPPETFKLLTAEDQLIQTLNQIKPDLGQTWKSAWDSLTIQDAKSAATSTRTAVDEISWKAPYDHLARLPWCQYDDKGKPTRASRFAWILHGDNLPAELNNDPSQDPLWKILSQNYEKLNKYVHISTIQEGDITYLKTMLSAIQECLEEYLHKGIDRLK